MTDSSLTKRIRAEQIRLLFRQAPTLFIGSAAGAFILGFNLWHALPESTLVLWIALVLASSASLAVLWWLYRRQQPDEAQRARWGHYFVFSGLSIGCIWGAAGVFFFPQVALEHQLFIALLLSVAAATCQASTSVWWPAFYVGFIPILAPMTIISLSQSDPSLVTIGVLSVTFMIMVGIFGYNLQSSIVSSLRLGFEKEALVAELREKRQEAEQASLDKSRFLAAASHDLRQPLQALGLFVEALENRVSGAETVRLVDRIGASLRVLDDMFHSLLDLSKLDAGVVQPNIQPLALQTLVDRLLTEFLPMAEARGLRLEADPTPAIVASDAILLERILRNLLSNAIRHTASGQVRIRCSQQGACYRIEIHDTGPGIPGADRDRIFQEYYQLANPERDRNKGLGLGLAIVKRLCTLLDHPLDVESARGQGSVFSVSVPLSQQCPDTSEQDSSHLAIPTFSGQHALLIEDDAIVRDATRQLLSDWGIKVSTYEDGDHLLASTRALSETPDFIITDYRLPGSHTGVELVQKIRQCCHQSIPAVIVSGDTAAHSLREAQDSGCTLLHKPVRPAQLRAWLGHVSK